jgi:lactoylglutathione lyase
VLGLTPIWGEEGDDYVDFDTGGGSALAIMNRAGQAEVVALRDGGDGGMLVLGVDNLDTALARPRAAGAEPGEVVERPDRGIHFAHLRDPAGNLVEVDESIPMDEE